MFDFAPDRTFGDVSSENLDTDSLAHALSSLSDRELDALQDDLDFCSFAGVPSPRILSLLDGLTELDAVWQNLQQRWKAPQLPAAY